MRDLNNGAVNLLGLATVDDGGADWTGMQLRRGDILLNRTNSADLVGKAGIVREDSEAVFASYLVRLDVDREKAEPEYVNYWLNTAIAQTALKRLSTRGVSQANINPTEFRKHCPLPLPTLPEQRKIAEILRTWDEAIEKLEALRAAKIQRLDGVRDILMARGSRGGRPATFGTFLTESRISGGDGSTARKITVRLYGKGAAEKSEQRSGSANTRYYRRKAGQIIWSKLDFLNGAFALLGDELDGYESTLDLPAFDCADSVNPHWLIEYLIRPSYYTQQVHLARGQRKARRIAPEDWLASPIRLPGRTQQDRIAEIIATARSEVETTGRSIEALSRQKRGLMQKLLTGEWRVKVEGGA
jgi:type I restriction enzyme, S subunit